MSNLEFNNLLATARQSTCTGDPMAQCGDLYYRTGAFWSNQPSTSKSYRLCRCRTGLRTLYLDYLAKRAMSSMSANAAAQREFRHVHDFLQHDNLFGSMVGCSHIVAGFHECRQGLPSIGSPPLSRSKAQERPTCSTARIVNCKSLSWRLGRAKL